MNREKLTPEKAVDRFLESLAEPGASRAEVDRSADRTLRHLEAEYEKLPVQRLPAWDGDRRRQGLRWVAIAAAAMVLAAGLMLLRVDTGSVATVDAGTITAFDKDNPRTLAQGETLGANQPLRVGEGNAMLSLADGSRVELSSNSDFSIVRISDGLELRLVSGNAIVTAAKQKIGHLSVRTPDCTVSVTGTVFSVRAEATGSRVSVFEGQVRVTQRDMVYTLSRGEQLATSPVLGAPGLEAEVRWSPNAAAVLALLQAPISAPAAPGVPPTPFKPSVQSEPSDLGSIEGLVTNTATGAPLGGVSVLVQQPPGPRVYAELKAGNDGRFKMERVPPGTYKFVTVAPGFWDVSSGPEVQVLGGQSVQGVRLRMSRAATLSGHIVDENGQPARSVSVTLWAQTGRVLSAANSGAMGGVTNDRGEYELTDILPGKYYIRTVPNAAHDAGIYYPGTLDADSAVPVDLSPGAVMTGINFKLPVVKLYSIRLKAPQDSLQWVERVFAPWGPTRGLWASGRFTQSTSSFSTPLIDQISASRVVVSTPPRFALQRTGRLIEDSTREVSPTSSRLVSVGPEEYVLNRVPPGKYRLSLTWSDRSLTQQSGAGGYSEFWAFVDAAVEVVDRDVDLGRLVSTPANLSIPVRFTYADGVPSEVAIRATSAQESSRQTLLNSLSPAHRLNNLRDEAYLLQFTLAAPDRYIALARYGVQDLLSGPLVVDGADRGSLEVVIDGPAGSIEGFVRDAKGDTVSNVEVVLVLVPPPYRRANSYLFRTALTDQNGKFRLTGVAPGEYGVYSWESAPPQAYLDPDWLRDHETRGFSVSVRKGQTVNANVRLIPQSR